jgi:hypothetical protein
LNHPNFIAASLIMSNLTDTLSVPSEQQYTKIHHNNTTIPRIQVLKLGVTDDLAAVKRCIQASSFSASDTA